MYTNYVLLQWEHCKIYGTKSKYQNQSGRKKNVSISEYNKTKNDDKCRTLLYRNKSMLRRFYFYLKILESKFNDYKFLQTSISKTFRVTIYDNFWIVIMI